MKNKKSALLLTAFLAMACAVIAWLFWHQHSAVQQHSAEGGVTTNDGGKGSRNPGAETDAVEAGQNDAAESRGASYFETFAKLKELAGRGDAAAQWQLARIYDLCFPYSLNAKDHLDTLDQFAKYNEGSKAAVEKLKIRLSHRCGAVDNGEPIPLEAVRGWIKQAAENGDVAAKIKMRAFSLDPLSGGEMDGFLDEALSTGSPEAMMELSNLVLWPMEGQVSERYMEIVGGPTAGVAWGIAACRAGMACGYGSILMDSLCVGTGRCNYSSYEDFAINELVPPAERVRLDKMLATISRLRKRNY